MVAHAVKADLFGGKLSFVENAIVANNFDNGAPFIGEIEMIQISGEWYIDVVVRAAKSA